MPEILGKVASVGTGNIYASALLLELPTRISKVVYWIKELNVNAIEYTILGSMDGVNYETVVNTTDLAKNASGFTTAITDPWPYLDFQIRANVGGAQGTVKIYCAGN